MEIDSQAPIKGSAQTEIEAPSELVWDVLTTFAEWPRWNPDISELSMEGTLAQGTVFRWKSGPGTITSTLQVVEAPHEVAWTGKALGLRAIHVYRLRPLDGGTSVSTEESWDGWVARIFRRRMQRTLNKAMEAGLESLKAEAENQARGGPPSRR